MDFNLPKSNKIFFSLIIIVFLLVIALLYSKSKAPGGFPTPYYLTIEKGQTLFSISDELLEDGVISSRRIFEFWMLIFGSDRNITEGQFLFEKPEGAFSIAVRISGKQFGIEKIKITFPEGFTAEEMADRLSSSIKDFNQERFLELAKPLEGYLFPDTYSFFPNTTPEEIIDELKNNFDKKVKSLEKEIKISGRDEKDVIKMASIIEKEANGEEDRQMIAGILWNRFDNNKLLQVDAPFLFLLNKRSNELTSKDLAIDSPYNTYKYLGLPPTPISNPGIASIEASAKPKSSPYFFYLHDSDGRIYYAKTYEEHKLNIRKYLNK